MTTPVATCPSCNSTSLQAMPTTTKDMGSAVVTEFALGTAAGMAAGSGAGPTVVFCLNCGCQWVPGTQRERHLRSLSGTLGAEAKRVAEAKEAAWQAEHAPPSGLYGFFLGLPCLVQFMIVSIFFSILFGLFMRTKLGLW